MKPAPESVAPAFNVALYGHLSGASGLASAARGTGAALAAVNVPFTGFDLPEGSGLRIPFDPGIPEEVIRERWPAATPIDLLHTNPDALARAIGARDPSVLRAAASQRFRIGFWAWEGLTGIPSHWPRAFGLVDEVWVPSQFTARAVSAHVPAPVVAMGHPVPPPPCPLSRGQLGLPEDVFLFLTILDALSNLERKNLSGVIKSYRLAFPEPTAGVKLLIKIRNLDEPNLRVLRNLTNERRDIQVVAGTLPQDVLGSLVASCDAYVSLHRAEGFGLTMAEAMAVGKPVIATNYSANTEFMASGTAYPVPYRLVELPEREGYFAAGTRWADPDTGRAATLMRHLVANPAEGRATGARAAAHIAATLSPRSIGLKMLDRLALLESTGRLSGGGVRPTTSKLVTAAAPTAAARPDPADPRSGTRPGSDREASSAPRVLVLTPMKSTAAHLDRYASLLESLDYPRDSLSLGILEGDSTDDTWARLNTMRSRLENRCCRVGLHRHHEGFQISGPRWAPRVQRQRRTVIAKARNRLLSLCLRDEDWVLWLDADLLSYPPNLLRELLAACKDIVVPHCLNEDGGTFDKNTFVFFPDRATAERGEYLIDGLFQPPSGQGRAYLGQFKGRGLTSIDAVGGTALLIRADLHRDGLIFPAWSHRGYIETEGLAMVARDMGVECWGMPDLEIVHIRG